ncbi:MAG: hypothetical protein FJ100_11555 [Deltaproteobacteria bacterium]|nr:hypothetical protein [Deltaproteobacteria bacterium]
MPDTRRPWSPLGFACAGLVLDGAIAVGATWPKWQGRPQLTVLIGDAFEAEPLVAHVIVSGLLFALWLRPEFGFSRTPATPLALLLHLFGGPLGALAAVLATTLLLVLPRSFGVQGDPLAAAKGEGAEVEPQPVRIVAQPKRLQPGAQQSFCDVFRHGTLAQRRTAVSLIGANFTPQLTEALRMALTDEHNSIRVQAGMVLMQLEDEFDRRQVQLEQGSDAGAGLQGFWADDAQLELARFYDMQAWCGLFDASRTRTAQINALRAYRAYLANHPDDLEAVAAVGRMLVRADQAQLAADWLGEQVAQGRDTSAILIWYVEALYLCGRFALVREVLDRTGSRLIGELPADAKIHGFLQLWQAASAPRRPPPPLDEAPAEAPVG